MKVKKYFAVALLAALTQSALGTDLYVYSLSSSQPVKLVNDFKSVTFGSSSISVEQADGSTVNVSLSDFDFMKFSPAHIQTGIETVAKATARLHFDGSKLRADNGTIVGVYAADGTALLGNGGSKSEVVLPVAAQRGMYVVKVKTSKGVETVKITK